MIADAIQIMFEGGGCSDLYQFVGTAAETGILLREGDSQAKSLSSFIPAFADPGFNEFCDRSLGEPDFLEKLEKRRTPAAWFQPVDGVKCIEALAAYIEVTPKMREDLGCIHHLVLQELKSMSAVLSEAAELNMRFCFEMVEMKEFPPEVREWKSHANADLREWFLQIEADIARNTVAPSDTEDDPS